MATRKVGQYLVDWVKLGSRVPLAARSELSGFRSRHETIKTRLETLSAMPDKFDWDFYKSHISKAGFVDKFEKGFAAVKVPYPEDKSSAAVAEEEKEYAVQCVEVLKETNENIAFLQQELADLRGLKPYEEMTSDDFLADKPDLQKQLDKEFKNFIYR